jgi:probable phosphoglycerate mutase
VTRELWLVRHGQTDWNRDRRLQGRTPMPLNQVGRQEAAALRSVLRDQSFVEAWSSPATRSVVTAQLAYGEAIVDSRLDEFDFGDLEGMTWIELSSEVKEALLEFDGYAAPGGESVADFRHRIEDFVTGLPGGRHLIFTHGGVIRVLAGTTPDTGHHLVVAR